MAAKKNTRSAPSTNEGKTPREAFRNIRNFLAGQHIGATRDDALLDEVLKCLFCKLIIERGEAENPTNEEDPFLLAKHFRSLFNIVREDFPEIYSQDTEILLDPQSLKYVMYQLDFCIMDAESDPIGDAFEVFVGAESKGNSGQFFTPRSAIKLLVEALDPKANETVLDPACGAGGFLSSVCGHLGNKGASPKDISGSIYGIDKDTYLAKLAKVHIALLTGEHPTVINGDSISLQNGEKNIREYLPTAGVDIILTNPPFGTKIISATPEVMQEFDLAHKWTLDKNTGSLCKSDKLQKNVPPQVLFVERCISLLKPGGRLGMVLPESILSNKSYRHVVNYILEHSELHAVMGMPEALFKTSGKGGTHTKTCLLVATKKPSKSKPKSSSIFMAEAKWCGQDSRARTIPHNDLPLISESFTKSKEGKLKEHSNLGFEISNKDISNFVLCPRYYDPQADNELNELSDTHHLVKMSTLIEEDAIKIATGDEVGKLAYGTGDIPFIRTSDISNWEMKADPKHGVSREIYEKIKDKQDVKPSDILMVRDGTYLIGTCAIVSTADNEMVYQSHLYKIRVNKNHHNLNPYLLLALLSSKVVQKQIRSKQFTMDIIDSLGDRISELRLPIPKSQDQIIKITELVKSSVYKRIEARELAKNAREQVTI
ncbi:MAG: restriction endonuclease subunit M [Desulfuromonas sp.]|uniref:N-6 DNA methylase n=1 Tax=Desulfuromonas sp. TaxID=892 RepID=UPI000CB29F76|nr:N-6 DNA methylase [Desulfuromonas sp.]PLX83673.1 MAG: restriction endonuclease subunit M [Desulfuromonas sp.]